MVLVLLHGITASSSDCRSAGHPGRRLRRSFLPLTPFPTITHRTQGYEAGGEQRQGCGEGNDMPFPDNCALAGIVTDSDVPKRAGNGQNVGYVYR